MQIRQINEEVAIRLLEVREQIKALQNLEKELRNQIADCFDDSLESERVELDSVEVLKFYNGIDSFKLDVEKAFQLVKERRIKGMAVKKIEVIDEEGLKLALQQGKITLEEYNSLYTQSPKLQIRVNRKKATKTADKKEALA